MHVGLLSEDLESRELNLMFVGALTKQAYLGGKGGMKAGLSGKVHDLQTIDYVTC